MAVSDKGKLGLKRETAGALAYLLGPVTGLLFLVAESDEYVRFHAMQSVVFSVAVFVLNTVLTISVILAVLVPLLALFEFAVWLFLMYQASQGKKWEIPFLEKLVYKFL